MIAYFPDPYPDELIFSVFCRYSDHSPFAKRTSAKTELFRNPRGPLDPEFLNSLTADAMQRIRAVGWERVLEKHTMLPQYVRFSLGKQKQQILQSCYLGDPMTMPGYHRQYRQSLMYCPECIKADRAEFGEGYWHRIHQIRNIGLCPKHHCRLVAADIGRTLASAEQTANDLLTALPVRDPSEIEIAEYLALVFEQDMDMCLDSGVKEILVERLQEYGLMSESSHTRSELLHYKLLKRYKSVPGAHTWEHDAVFANNPRFYDTCLLGLYLGISSRELCGRKQITRLKTSVPLPRLETSRPGNKPIDWVAVDEHYLPSVAAAIDDIRSGKCKFKRPQITKGSIERYLRLPSGCISMMPKCRALIEAEQKKQR
jgi:hypothetical protein